MGVVGDNKGATIGVRPGPGQERRRVRREIVTDAKSLGASSTACDAVALATSEALTNAVVHAYVDQEVGELFVEAASESALA